MGNRKRSAQPGDSPHQLGARRTLTPRRQEARHRRMRQYQRDVAQLRQFRSEEEQQERNLMKSIRSQSMDDDYMEMDDPQDARRQSTRSNPRHSHVMEAVPEEYDDDSMDVDDPQDARQTYPRDLDNAKRLRELLKKF
ncbi:hypothetical protein M3Y97_00255700 [Aphelenchoides bicaudatus]|nr:hypothetical protein M3Y97_00255700 [Aphelenchoides bicaudatus]